MKNTHSSNDSDPEKKRINKEEEKMIKKDLKSFAPKKNHDHDQRSAETSPSKTVSLLFI